MRPVRQSESAPDCGCMKLTRIGEEELKKQHFLKLSFSRYAQGLNSATALLLALSTTRTTPADFHPYKIV